MFSRIIDPQQVNIPPKSDNIRWSYIGPGVGGSMFGIGIKPDDPKVIITGGDMGAACRTDDGGNSWTMLGGSSGDQPGVGGTWNVQFSESNPDIVWIVGSSAYKSTDGGKSWRRNAPFKTFGGLAIDPKNPDVVYISEGYVPRFNLHWVTGNVYKTIDGGKSWKRLTRPYAPQGSDTMLYRNYSTIVIDPNSKYDSKKGHARIYIAGRGGFCRSDDYGQSWKVLSAPFGKGQICDLVLTTIDQQPKMIIVRSKDGGQTWSDIGNDIAFTRGAHIEIDDTDPRHIFVLTTFAILEGWDDEAPVAPSAIAGKTTDEKSTNVLLLICVGLLAIVALIGFVRYRNKC